MSFFDCLSHLKKLLSTLKAKRFVLQNINCGTKLTAFQFRTFIGKQKSKSQTNLFPLTAGTLFQNQISGKINKSESIFLDGCISSFRLNPSLILECELRLIEELNSVYTYIKILLMNISRSVEVNQPLMNGKIVLSFSSSGDPDS